MEKSIFSKFGVYFRWKMCKTVNRNFLKKNRKNPITWGKSMSYNIVFLCIKDFDENSFLKLWTIKKIIKKMTKKSKDAHKFLNFYPKILIVWLLERALNSDHKYIIYWGIWKSRFFENLGCIFDEKCVKPSIETFLKKIAKSNFLRKINVVQCCIFVYQGFLMKFHFWNFGQ